MAISIIDIISLVKDLISDGDKLSKFKEIVADLKELISDIKDLIKKWYVLRALFKRAQSFIEVNMEQHFKEFIEFSPIIAIILIFMWQNNVFVRPEQLEKKHREIIKEVEAEIKDKYVEINAYKEFQNRVYSELAKVSDGIDELKDFLMKG